MLRMRETIRPAHSAAKRNSVTRAMRRAALQMMADGGLGMARGRRSDSTTLHRRCVMPCESVREAEASRWAIPMLALVALGLSVTGCAAIRAHQTAETE